MKNFKLLVLFSFTLLLCQATFAQSFKIGTIDIYGNRKISSDTIRAHLSIKEGNNISPETFKSVDEAERLKQIPGVKYALVHPVCCDTAGNLMMYIGIGETDSVILKHRKAPVYNVTLPHKMVTAYNDLMDQIQPAIKSGQSIEDYSHGYSLLSYPPARSEQNKFIVFARESLPILANVLKKSKNAEQRAIAAEIIAYSVNRKKVVDYLLYATDDPDENVRNNATRALGVLDDYVLLHPELKITIPAGPFIRMINSLVWTDRNKGSLALMHMSITRDPKLLKEIKQQALLSIIEMAKWKDRGHASPGFLILGRIAGVDDKLLLTENYSKNWAVETEKLVNKCTR